MREILFRGKAINRDDGFPKRLKLKNGDWVYGIVSKVVTEEFREKLPYEMTCEATGVCGIDVDYKTIGQFTGLTDQNNNPIYEGDIVKSLCNEPATVVYGTQGAMFVAQLPHSYYHIGDWVKVIGNIHDNPELISDEKCIND